MAVWSLRNDGYCWGKARCCEGLRADALKKKSRVYPLRDGFCALRARRPFFICCLGRLRRGGETFAARLQEKAKRGLSFERGFLCPAGAGAFLFLLLWPPARRAARRGRLWGCAPFTAPFASPPKHPAGAFQHPTFCEGCAAFAAGASSLRSVISLRAAQCQRSPSRWMRGRGRRVGFMESQIE